MAFEYTKKARDTMYAGCLFRSRLEATWAAFFDICGIKWVYEPFDLPGWSPDFLIADELLAEVKPFTTPDIEIQWKIFRATKSTPYLPLFLGPSPISEEEIGFHIGNDFDISVDKDGKFLAEDQPGIEPANVFEDGSLFCCHDNEENFDISNFCKPGIESLVLKFNQAKNKVRFTVR